MTFSLTLLTQFLEDMEAYSEVDTHLFSTYIQYSGRAVARALIGGGGVCSYIYVLPGEFLLKSTLMTTDCKRNSSGRTRIYEYTPPPPPIRGLFYAVC